MSVIALHGSSLAGAAANIAEQETDNNVNRKHLLKRSFRIEAMNLLYNLNVFNKKLPGSKFNKHLFV